MHKKKKKSEPVVTKIIESWKDVYQLPLHLAKYGSWVYDAIGNFVFQFEIENKIGREELIKVINGEKELIGEDTVYHKEGYILDSKNNIEIILIRGWGNLTGIGAMNLSEETAAMIQDTFAKFIVEQLNKR